MTTVCKELARKEATMRVELHIFSGRPDPFWELSEEEAAELAKRLAGLPYTHQPPRPGGLGYRGFSVSNATASAGLPMRVSVFDGVIVSFEGGKTTYYKDTNNIEPWLLDQARKQGYGEILDQTIGNQGL